MGKFRVDNKHSIACPKAIPPRKAGELTRDCGILSPEVAVLKGESVHECKKHGRFKVKYDGRILWWKEQTAAHWVG